MAGGRRTGRSIREWASQVFGTGLQLAVQVVPERLKVPVSAARMAWERREHLRAAATIARAEAEQTHDRLQAERHRALAPLVAPSTHVPGVRERAELSGGRGSVPATRHRAYQDRQARRSRRDRSR